MYQGGNHGPLITMEKIKIIDISCVVWVDGYAEQLKSSSPIQWETKSQNNPTMESYSAIKMNKLATCNTVKSHKHAINEAKHKRMHIFTKVYV